MTTSTRTKARTDSAQHKGRREHTGEMLINGRLLRSDRMKQRYSREALAAKANEDRLHRFSVSSLRRAEAGRATASMIGYIARVLGYPADRYMLEKRPKDVWHTAYDLNGDWLALYLEEDINTTPYMVTEELFIEHSGSAITGAYKPALTMHPEKRLGEYSFVMEGAVIENVIFGRYFVEGRSYPRGAGVFQMIIMKDGEWTKGFCTFASDDHQIGLSPNIWIKKSSSGLPLLRKQAEKFLTEKTGLFLKAPLSLTRN